MFVVNNEKAQQVLNEISTLLGTDINVTYFYDYENDKQEYQVEVDSKTIITKDLVKRYDILMISDTAQNNGLFLLLKKKDHHHE